MEEYKVIIHPSVISYDYRIAWTWDEMEKRNKRNNNVDAIRLSFWLPQRPYWKPMFSEWKTHWGKERFNLNELEKKFYSFMEKYGKTR